MLHGAGYWRLYLSFLLLVFPVISATCSCLPSMKLGPTLFSSGTCFKVWAPHVATAQVVPQGSSSWPATSMTQSGQIWSVCVPNAIAGDGYLYSFAYNGSTFTRLDPYAQDLLLLPPLSNPSYAYSRIHDPNYNWGPTPPGFPPPIDQAIIYELLLPDLGGHNWTAVSSGAPGTPFANAIQYLDHFVSLGITHIELMPTGQFCGTPGELGYDPCAPMVPQVAWGGYIGMKNFVNAANQKGIAVIMDVIFNHMNPRPQNILLDYDGFEGTVPSVWGVPGTLLDGIYYYETPELPGKNPNLGFAPSPWGPRPKYDSPYVASWLQDTATMWATEYHVSGFRFDSVACVVSNCSQPDNNAAWILLQETTSLLKTLAPQMLLQAESNGLFITQSVNNTNFCSLGGPGCSGPKCAPGNKSVCGGLGFDTQWYGSFHPNMLEQIIGNVSPNIKIPGLAPPNITEITSILLDCTSMGGRTVFVENHDASEPEKDNNTAGAWGRIAAAISSSIPPGASHNATYWTFRKSQFAVAAMISSSCGIPMLFMGQEFMQYTYWLDVSLFSSGNASSFMQAFTDLFTIRKTYSPLFFSAPVGSLVHLCQSCDIAVIQKSTIVLVINVGLYDVSAYQISGVTTDGVYQVLFSGDNAAYGCFQQSVCNSATSMFSNFGLTQTVQISGGSGVVDIPAWSILILNYVGPLSTTSAAAEICSPRLISLASLTLTSAITTGNGTLSTTALIPSGTTGHHSSRIPLIIIIAIVIGSVLAIAAIVGAVVVWFCWKQKHAAQRDNLQPLLL